MQVSTWPNPFTDKLNIAMQSGYKTTLTVRITETSGKLVRTCFYEVQKGSNQFAISGLQPLQKGIYFIQVSDGNGTVYAPLTLMKK